MSGSRDVPTRSGLLVIILAAVTLSGCSHAAHPEDVVLDDLGEPGYTRILDTAADQQFLGLVEAATGATYDDSAPDNTWIRGWTGNDRIVMILLAAPGGSLDSSTIGLLESRLLSAGFAAAEGFDPVPGTVAVHIADPEGDVTMVVFFKEAFLGVVAFDSDMAALGRTIVERQLAAVPRYDPTDEYRLWLIGFAGLAFAGVLWMAIRSSRRRPPTLAPRSGAAE